VAGNRSRNSPPQSTAVHRGRSTPPPPAQRSPSVPPPTHRSARPQQTVMAGLGPATHVFLAVGRFLPSLGAPCRVACPQSLHGDKTEGHEGPQESERLHSQRLHDVAADAGSGHSNGVFATGQDRSKVAARVLMCRVAYVAETRIRAGRARSDVLCQAMPCARASASRRGSNGFRS
jgi:hypothetical protein